MKLPARLRPLEPYLLGQPSDEGEWQMVCPLHPDTKRSASLNVQTGVWNCFAGCGGGSVKDLLRNRDNWHPAPDGSAPSRPPRKEAVQELPPLSYVADCTASLLENRSILSQFRSARGLSPKTIRKFKLGYDPNQSAITIPVFDEDGDLLTVRYYNLNPSKGRKFWHIKGHGGPFLYPLNLWEDDDVLILCEGELDAAILHQAGYAALTKTAGATTWKAGWTKLFEGKTVYLLHDMDKAGQAANVKIGRALSKVATVKIVTLPYPVTDDHGLDITDFWKESGGTRNEAAHEKFESLLTGALHFETRIPTAKTLDPEDAYPNDAVDAELHGKPLRMTLTIKGRGRSGYVIPKRAEYFCDKSAGTICSSCPMSETMHDELDIPRNDPIVLKMIGASNEDVDKILKEQVGIPSRCKVVQIEREHQSVEILYARPSVDHSDGVNGNHLNSVDTVLRLTSVGRHDTPSNCNVQITGAVQNNPRNQEAEFQVWDLAQVKAMSDTYEFDPEVHKSLKIFQPRRNERVIDKLNHIAGEMSRTVTRIYGRPDVHIGMDLVFHSALQFEFDGQMLDRGWLEMLAVGDTRTGKSLIAHKLIQHYQAGEVIDCERASMPGVIGGVQQIRNEWMVTWGAIPVNDRRLVVLDEVSGLTTEDIGQMSGMRASGVAAIEKVVSEKTLARTRKIWLGNPRDDLSMSNYSFGVYSIKPLIGRNEDIARFDFAMSLSAGDVPIGDIHQRRNGGGENPYTSELSAALIRWAWTRKPEDIQWGPGATDLVLKLSRDLGGRYTREPPLILPQDVRIKLARIAVAIAVRVYSTRDGLTVRVTRNHVRTAYRYLDSLYSNERFGYRFLSSREHTESRHATSKTPEAIEILSRHPGLPNFMLTRPEGKFFARDLEEVLNVPREGVNGIINGLIQCSMVTKDRGFVRIQPELQKVLKELLS